MVIITFINIAAGSGAMDPKRKRDSFIQIGWFDFKNFIFHFIVKKRTTPMFTLNSRCQWGKK